VNFLPGTDDYVLSAGQDKEIKLWNLNLSDQDSPCTLKASLKLNEAIENFCFIEEEGLIIVANGNLITLIAYDQEEGELRILQNIHAFQKPIMKV
tara:strand:- start:50 stop:334 length:285 start_codon:yes stop_codon:yes gene_type:complete